MLKKPCAAVWHPLQMQVLGNMWVATFCVTGSSLPHHFLTIHSCSSITLPKPLSGRLTERCILFLRFLLSTKHLLLLSSLQTECDVQLLWLISYYLTLPCSSDGFLRVILSLGFPYIFSSFIYTLSLDECILWPLVTPKALPFPLQASQAAPYFKHSQ